MVQKRVQLLTDLQREAILDFIDHPPKKMTQTQRSLRFNLKDVDFNQLEQDLENAEYDLKLMKIFSNVDIPMGRATEDKRHDLKAQVNIRKKQESDTKAEFEVNQENVEN